MADKSWHRSACPRFDVLEERAMPSILTVTNFSDHGFGSLRRAVALAHDGDTIKFASWMPSGTITLTTGEIAINVGLTIQGPSASKLAISGNNASRIFDIDSNASAVTITGVTLKNGLTNTFGGAILDSGAPLTLRWDALSNNRAQSSSINVSGGALAVFGQPTVGVAVTVANCRFSNDAAIAGTALGGSALGGAVYLDAEVSTDLVLSVTNSSFVGDFATGSNSDQGGGALGGGVYVSAGEAAEPQFRFSGDTFSSCTAAGGASAHGNVGGSGSGGAIYYSALFAAAPALSVTGCNFSSNSALG